MIFKKDNFIYGALLGLLAPVLGFYLFKVYKFSMISIREMWFYMMNEQGFKTLSVGLSISLLLNAFLFTIYVNTNRDQTAKGIFTTTLLYGLLILSIKTFS